MKKKPISHPKMVESSLKRRYADGGMIEEAKRSGLLGTKHKVDQEIADETAPKRRPASVSEPEALPHKDVRTEEQKAKAKVYEETGMLPGYAHGGSVEEEREVEEAASLAAAIMTKRRKMAGGGEILSEDSIYADDSTQSDLSQNAIENANMEDRLSFNALRKENYSESEGLEQLDQPEDSNLKGHEMDDEHDESLVGSIRRKMKVRSPITK